MLSACLDALYSSLENPDLWPHLVGSVSAASRLWNHYWLHGDLEQKLVAASELNHMQQHFNIALNVQSGFQHQLALTTLFKSLFDTLAVGVCTFNQQGDIQFANPLFYQLLQLDTAWQIANNKLYYKSNQSFDVVNLNLDNEQISCFQRMASNNQGPESQLIWDLRTDHSKGTATLLLFEETILKNIDTRLMEEQFKLTKKEMEITKLMVSDISLDDIAEQLQISGHTVRHHVKNIYSKFSISTRAQLVKAFFDHYLPLTPGLCVAEEIDKDTITGLADIEKSTIDALNVIARNAPMLWLPLLKLFQ